MGRSELPYSKVVNMYDIHKKMKELSSEVENKLKIVYGAELLPPILLFWYNDNQIYNYDEQIIYFYVPDEYKASGMYDLFLQELLYVTKPYEKDFKIYYTTDEDSLKWLEEYAGAFWESDVIPISKEIKYYDITQK
jgi:hypothetical protein